MRKKVIGEFLLQFYRKRTSSFLAGIYKAIITGESEDIHRLRVDVKKIYALYSLFEMIDPRAFKKQARYNLFIKLFKLAGRIREIQVHQAFLAKPKFRKTDYSSFIAYLKEEENKATRNFILAIKEFNDKSLRSAEKEIRRICSFIPAKRLSRKSGDFIRKKALKIRVLQTGNHGFENAHKIRKHLKAMSTISTIIAAFSPDEKLNKIIAGLNKSEMMIGEWHDKVVLSDAIDQYLKTSAELNEDNLAALNALHLTLVNENQSLLKRLMPEVRKVADLILEPEEPPVTPF